MPNKAKEQQQARQWERRKRKARGRREKRKSEGLLTDLHRHPDGHAKDLKEDGLFSKDL